jgi:hypothetical protein
MSVTNLCKECGEVHDNPKEHIFTYIDSHELLNKRGLVDSITLEPFIDPVELSSCGHTFSRYSIESALSTKKECPECRKKSTKISETSRIIREQVNQLEVVCPNICGVTVERQSLANHLLETCPITKSFCTNKYKEGSCIFYGTKTELEKHKNECTFRVLECEGKCGVIAIEQMPPHQSHNCIHFLSQKSKQMMEFIAQVHPAIVQLQQHIQIHGHTLNMNKTYIQTQDTKLKERDTLISFLEKKSIIQDEKITKLTEEIHLLNKETYETKFKLLKEKAVKDDIMAQIEVGRIFENGNKYVMKNIDIAKLWYGKAQAQDSKMAIQCLKSLETTERETWTKKRTLEDSESGTVDSGVDTLGDTPSNIKKQKIDYGVSFGKSMWDDKTSVVTSSSDSTTDKPSSIN